MGKKIENKWAGMEGYNCFACAPNNPIGLHLHFEEDGEWVVSHWTPDARYQGWLNTLHGGITCTLMDEVAGWVVTEKLKKTGVTMQLNTKFKKKIDTTGGELTVRAKLREMKRNIAIIDCEITNADGETAATAEAMYFTTDEKIIETK